MPVHPKTPPTNALPAAIPLDEREVVPVTFEGQSCWLWKTGDSHGVVLPQAATCVTVTPDGRGHVDIGTSLAPHVTAVIALQSRIATRNGRMWQATMTEGWRVAGPQVLRGTMADTGDTYPVCDACGWMGTSFDRDGDPCLACRDKWEASNA